MALETREEFLEEWRKVAVKLLGPDAPEEAVATAGNRLYDARVVAYQVAEEGLNLTAHRYFHGLASIPLNFMLQMPLPDEVPPEVLPFLVGEYLFHQGFIAGIAHANRDPDAAEPVGLDDEADALECLGKRDNIVLTREELEKRLMPAPVEAILEVQKMLAALDEAQEKAQGDGEPVIPPEGEEGRGYF